MSRHINSLYVSERPGWFERGKVYRLFYALRMLFYARRAPIFQYDPGRVRVLLISRDIFSCLSTLIENFIASGIVYENIYIINQGTTSDECKFAYSDCQSRGVNVISLPEPSQNYGPYALWLDPCLKSFYEGIDHPYIVSDSDLRFPEVFPADWLERLFFYLNEYRAFPKVSLPLRVKDIDVDNSDFILEHESRLGSAAVYRVLRLLQRVPDELRVCQTDTTLALYRPHVGFSTLSIRLDSKYELIHMPWYRSFTEKFEYKFYQNHKHPDFGMWS